MSDEVILEMVTHELDDRVVVELRGEVDQSNAETVERQLHSSANGTLLVIDLRPTTYFDSAGVAVLHSLRQQAQLALLVEPDSIVRRVLEITALDQLVPLLRSATDAATPPTRG
jgi:anti-anti-sigma factor